MARRPVRHGEDGTYGLQIDSVPFVNLRYEIRAGHLLITDKKNGTLCMDLMNVHDFAKEINEVADVWRGRNNQRARG